MCQAKFQKSVQTVLTETPRSRMVLRPKRPTQLFEKRKVLRYIKNTIERDINANGETVVLQNRICWDKFDKIRKTHGLCSKKPNVDENTCTTTVSRKRKHGCNSQNLNVDKDQLLQEARSWAHNETVNWKELGRRYGLTTPNCGQIVKEYLAEQEISAACICQRSQRSQRRPKKRLPGGRYPFQCISL